MEEQDSNSARVFPGTILPLRETLIDPFFMLIHSSLVAYEENSLVTRQEKEILQTLVDLTTKLLEEAPLEVILNLVTNAAVQLLPAEHASIRVLDESGTKLLCGARSGTAVSEKPMSFRVGEGIMGWVVKHGSLARVNDGMKDGRFKKPQRQGFEVRSLLVVPLRISGHSLGVLGLTSSYLGAFTREHEPIAILLANCAAPVIAKARLERLALMDHNTMAFNQRYLFPRLRQEIHRARRYGHDLAVLMMDLDHFKSVNDRHGHAAGDLALQIFADRVRDTVRLSDVLVRRGGEEFVLIAPNADIPAASLVAERIRSKMSETAIELSNDESLVQTVSIGVVNWNGAEDERELEARADAAMYEAKRLGRNRVVARGNDEAKRGVG